MFILWYCVQWWFREKKEGKQNWVFNISRLCSISVTPKIVRNPHFYNPRKCWKTFGFVTFSGGRNGGFPTFSGLWKWNINMKWVLTWCSLKSLNYVKKEAFLKSKTKLVGHMEETLHKKISFPLRFLQ